MALSHLPDPRPQRPPLCGKCRYPLAGLPAKGTCPECGHEYNIPERIGLDSFSTRKRRTDRGLAVARTITLFVLAALVFSLGLCLIPFASEPTLPTCNLSLIAVVLVMGGIMSWIYQRQGR